MQSKVCTEQLIAQVKQSRAEMQKHFANLRAQYHRKMEAQQRLITSQLQSDLSVRAETRDQETGELLDLRRLKEQLENLQKEKQQLIQVNQQALGQLQEMNLKISFDRDYYKDKSRNLEQEIRQLEREVQYYKLKGQLKHPDHNTNDETADLSSGRPSDTVIDLRKAYDNLSSPRPLPQPVPPQIGEIQPMPAYPMQVVSPPAAP